MKSTLRYCLNSVKSRVANLIGLRRLFAATSYLLVRELNTDMPEGSESNRRLEEAFLSLCKTLQPSLFFDVGANDGSASIAVRSILPTCEIHAFEANPQIHTRHRERLNAQGIEYWNLALTDHIGQTVVYAPRRLSRAYVNGEVVPASIIEGEDTGKTSLLRRNEEATYEEFTVEATTLDAFSSEHVNDWRQRSAFLWVDVEGAAHIVLAGASRLLKQTSAIFLETEGFDWWEGQSDCATIVNQLIRLGFLPVARDRQFGDKQFNVLFVHQDVSGHILQQLFNADSPLRLCRAKETETVAKPSVAPSASPGVRAKETASKAPSHPYVSLGNALQAEIPILIPCFNTVTYVRGMVEQLRARGMQRLILLDNASTYPPMREFLADPGPGVTVVAQSTNKGPRASFLDAVDFGLLPQFFCVTDPDLVFNPQMPPDFIAQMASLTERLSIGKAGLALDIADHADMRHEEFSIAGRHWKIWEWEEQFWQDQLDSLPGGDPVFRANVDTTFAIYNKRFFDTNEIYKAVRVAGRFTCRHLPWYRDVGLPSDELEFYRGGAGNGFYLRDGVAKPAST